MSTTTIAPSTTMSLSSAAEGAVLHRSLKQDDKMPSVVSGNGIWFTSDEGVEYLDACGGAAVACLGSGHPKIIKAITDQLQKLTYTYSGAFTHPSSEALANKLIASSEGAFSKVLFLSGGSESVEAMIKLSRQYWIECGKPERKNFIARKMSYHGNTLGALSLCDHPARCSIYMPLLNKSNFHHVSPAYYYRYAEAGESEEAYVQRLKDELDAKFQELGPDTVAGFAMETTVGATSGVVTPPKGYIRAMKEVCDKYGALFMLDEVMSGMGRMGSLHAWQSIGEGVQPDIQACAKGLGAGFQPIGAVLASERIISAMKKGTGMLANGHTYQAHPIACAAALAVQEVFEEEKLLEQCTSTGEYFSAQLKEKIALSPLASAHVGEVRGRGMWWGLEFVQNKETKEPFPLDLKPRFGDRVARACLKEQHMSTMGFSGCIDGKQGDHMVLAPPYNVKKEECDMIAERLVKGIESAVKSI